MAPDGIEIITDSTCDIPDHLIQEHNIMVIPHIIIWGEKQYRDRVDMQPEEFYRRLETDPVYPSSSQASVFDYLHAYEEAAARGARQMIVLTVSSAMSGAYQMALNAAKLIKIPVTVIDSKGPTMTLGWQVLAAARARAAGLELNQILEKVDAVRRSMVQFVCMDKLDYLHKGGRIGGAVKWVGSMLNVRPLVSINHESGLVKPESLARTHKSAVEMLYKRFFERIGPGQGLRIAVLHGGVEEEARALARRIQEEFNPLELLINITGPVLGINTGPGALALCGYTDDEKLLREREGA